MNPFTRAILKGSSDQALREFVEHWDALERLVIRVYKGKAAPPADEAEYRQLRGWLRRHYRRWQPALLPYWQPVKAGGEPVTEDPFAFLMAVSNAAGFLKNWEAMQTLPASREALNSFLVDRLGKNNTG